ncbi:MAG: DUF3261 domain-containing protein [Proteobacteria bacterium]|nr:DUF3261 domain-containing protein [Pseudomonadota bacterium]
MGRPFRLYRSFLFVLVVLFINACRTPSVRVDNVLGSRYFSEKFKDYRIENLELDYIARCRVRIKTPTESQSGSCRIVVTHAHQLQLTIFHPMGGTLVLVYMDDKTIQILNRSEKTYYRMENNKENRRRVPEVMNLRISELQTILWGREIKANRDQLTFHFKNRQPWQIRKTEGERQLIVSYEKWLQYEGAWFPKIFQVEDLQWKTSVKMAITEFSPGFAENLEIDNVPEDYKVVD